VSHPPHEVFADQLDNDWENLPTKAEARAWVKAAAHEAEAQRRADLIAAWRERNKQAECSDLVAYTLAELEAAFAPKGESA
jgi:hypothetical protein